VPIYKRCREDWPRLNGFSRRHREEIHASNGTTKCKLTLAANIGCLDVVRVRTRTQDAVRVARRWTDGVGWRHRKPGKGRNRNRQELVHAVAAATGQSKAAASEAIDAFIGTVTKAVTKGDAVQLVGFGSFSTGARAARVGRNPSTGAEIQIPAAKTVKFTAGKAFKDAAPK